MTKKSALPTGNISQFITTYKNVVRMVWQINPSLFIKITLVNAGAGLIVYPSLLLSKNIIDTVINTIKGGNLNQGITALVVFSALTLLIDRIDTILSDADSVYSATLSRNLTENINVNIAEKINAITVPQAENPDTRNLIQKVQDNSGGSAWSLIAPLSSLPDTLFTIVSVSISLVSFNPILILPAFILAFPSVIIGITQSKAFHEFSTENAPRWRIFWALDDFTSKGRYLYENKILGHTKLLTDRRRHLSQSYFQKDLALRVKFMKKRFVVSLPISIYDSGLRIFLYFLAITQKISLGNAQMISNSNNRFIANLTRLIRQINDVYQNYLFTEDYNTLMNLPTETSDGSIKFPSQIQSSIEFVDVWFKYPQNPHYTLKGVTFKINKGENLAIVGENGAGKTTIIKLLCRFYQPQRGEILIDGININQYSLPSLRKHLAALFQDFAQFPFSGTDNIHFGDVSKKATRHEIHSAAKLTGIHKFLISLPLGYKNPLDKEFKNGIEPSKGQWQRIALARTLYRQAPVIILDEPTSNVDPESEESIFHDLLKAAKKQIVIMVSHRFSTVRRADKILVLENGQVIEYGNHLQLMNLQGRYYELFSLQAQSYH